MERDNPDYPGQIGLEYSKNPNSEMLTVLRGIPLIEDPEDRVLLWSLCEDFFNEGDLARRENGEMASIFWFPEIRAQLVETAMAKAGVYVNPAIKSRRPHPNHKTTA